MKLFLTGPCLVFAACLPLSALQCGNIGNTQVFPSDNPWNWDISGYAVHPNSANYINRIGAAVSLHPDFGTDYGGAPNGIPYVVVNGSQPKIPVNFTDYGDESDPGPYPVPLTAPIEGGPSSDGDRHVIAVDTSNRILYELYYAWPQAASWDASCGAVFDLKANSLRPDGWTSADAAGLPIFPGLVRYEEVVVKKVINHALRFTADTTQRAYIYPARHYASSSTDVNRPPMGLRFRLKVSFDTSGFSQTAKVILVALKKYGMMVADNGGDWFISGAPDDRFSDDELGELKSLKGSDFEAVRTVDANGDPIYPPAAEKASLFSYKNGLELSVRPNPVNTNGEIAIFILAAMDYSLSILDAKGRLIRILLKGKAGPIEKAVAFDGSRLCSGIYFCILKAGDFRVIKSLLLIR